jgi:hypothetical protein
MKGWTRLRTEPLTAARRQRWRDAPVRAAELHVGAERSSRCRRAIVRCAGPEGVLVLHVARSNPAASLVTNTRACAPRGGALGGDRAAGDYMLCDGQRGTARP